MKKFLLLGSIVFLFMLTGCSQDEETFIETQIDVTMTRSANESDDALATSALIQDLREYNDSLSNIEANGLNSNKPIIAKKTLEIAAADAVGFAKGYSAGKIFGKDVAIALGVLNGAAASVEKATKKNVPGMPPLNGDPNIKYYENCYSAATHDANFNLNYNHQLIIFPTNYEKYKTYLNAGVLHNLVVAKYRQGLDDEDIVINIFDQSVNEELYSEVFQSKLIKSIHSIVNGDFEYIDAFVDFNSDIVTISQKKASEILNIYVDFLMNSNSQVISLEDYTLTYLDKIRSSQEISIGDKEILFYTIPIFITSSSLWNTNTEML